MGARASEMPLPTPTSVAVDKGEIAVESPNTRRPRRAVFRQTGHAAVQGYAPVCGDSNDPDTVACGFKKRLCRDLPQVTADRIEKLRAHVRKVVRETLPIVTPKTSDEWLDEAPYPQSRKDQLREEIAALRGGHPTKRQASKVKSFVKTEGYVEYKHVRLILSRSDAAKVWLGPRFKAVEEAVYALPQFIKHTAVSERPAKIASLRKACAKYFLTDYTAFESHFTAILMDAIECEVYRWCLQNDPDVEFLCKILTGWNVIRTSDGTRVRLRARRMSGDMCTSLGNGVTNWFLTHFLVTEKGGEVTGYVEGDDGIFCSTVDLTAEDYASLGFTIKICEVDDPCRCVPRTVNPDLDPRFGCAEGAFCGIVCAEDGQILKDPRKFTANFGWTSSFIHAGQKIMDELARAKALSAAYESPHCPIIRAMADRVLFETKHVSPRFVYDGYHQSCPRDEKGLPPCQTTDSSRELFRELYGVCVQDQLTIEAMVRQGNWNIDSLMPPGPQMAHYFARYVEATPG